MKRNHQIIIKFSKEELEKIKEKSRVLGLSMSSYIRLVVLSSKIREIDTI